MVTVTGLRLPAAWRSVQVDNPSFEISADELNIFNEMEADASIDWQTVIQDNIIALNNFTISASGIVSPANRELIGLAGGLAINVPTATPFDVRINNVSIGRFNETDALLSVPLDMGTNLINNVVDPVGAQDAATRNYVDNNPPPHNLLSATHPDTLTASPPAQGSLIKGTSSLWAEFTIGSPLQVLRVNVGGTDLEYFTVAGVSDELVNVFEAGTQVGVVARQLNFSNGSDFGITEDGPNNRFDIAISRNVANGIAGLDASGRLTASELPTNVAFVDAINAWADGVKQTFNPNATNAGINVGIEAGDPSVLTDADVWYNSATNKFRGRENGVSVDLVTSVGSLNIIEQGNSSVEVIDVGTGQVDTTVDALLQSRYTVAGGLVMSNSIDLVANNLLNAGFIEASGTVPAVGFFRLKTTDDIVWRNQANDGDVLLSKDTNDRLTFDGAFVQRQAYASALGDETTDATASDTIRYAFPYAFAVTRLQGYARTAPTGADMLIQFQNITQALTIAIVTITAGTNVGSQTTITNPGIAQDDEIEVSITQIGSTIAGAGVKGTMIGFVV